MRQLPCPLDARRKPPRDRRRFGRSEAEPEGRGPQAGGPSQCSQHYRKAPKIGAALSQRQIGQSKEVKALSWRMQHRLHRRYVKLKARGKRELQNKLNLPIPGNVPAH